MDKQIQIGHSGAFKANRFQSGFRDLKKKIQSEQKVNRKKSGFRAAPPTVTNFRKFHKERLIFFQFL